MSTANTRRVSTRLWGDGRFRALSPLQASGQALWLYLMTAPHSGLIPGVLCATRLDMAERLGWAVDAFDAAMAEVTEQGMAEVSWPDCLIWLPRALRYNAPHTPNVVLTWRAELLQLPECALRDRLMDALRAELAEISPLQAEAFDRAADGIGGRARRRVQQGLPARVGGAVGKAVGGAVPDDFRRRLRAATEVADAARQ